MIYLVSSTFAEWNNVEGSRGVTAADGSSGMFKLNAGSIALLSFQEDDGDLPLSLSFVLVDPLPKGLKIKFAFGNQYFAQMMQDGPHLTFTTSKYVSSGTIFTWTASCSSRTSSGGCVKQDVSLPSHLSVKTGEGKKQKEVGYFTHSRAFQKLDTYQLYIYGGSEERPVFVFGLLTQTDKQFPKALKKGKSIIVMKRMNLGDAVVPTNFVFCPYLSCEKGSCLCKKFVFRGDKTKMLGALTFPKNWFGQGKGKSFPNTAAGWIKHKYKFNCVNCEVWVCKHTHCVYDGAVTEVQGYVWANERWHCAGVADANGDNTKHKCTCLCSHHKTCTIVHHGKVLHHCPHDELRRRLSIDVMTGGSRDLTAATMVTGNADLTMDGATMVDNDADPSITYTYQVGRETCYNH
jgi:hypothetical protein